MLGFRFFGRKTYAMSVRFAPTQISALTERRRRLVSLAMFADLADVSTKTIRRRIADGTLPAYRVGRLIKMDVADLDRIAVRIPTVGGGGDVVH